jgi:hypothetical protein
VWLVDPCSSGVRPEENDLQNAAKLLEVGRSLLEGVLEFLVQDLDDARELALFFEAEDGRGWSSSVLARSLKSWCMNSEPGSLNLQSAHLTPKFNNNVATKTDEERAKLTLL